MLAVLSWVSTAKCASITAGLWWCKHRCTWPCLEVSLSSLVCLSVNLAVCLSVYLPICHSIKARQIISYEEYKIKKLLQDQSSQVFLNERIKDIYKDMSIKFIRSYQQIPVIGNLSSQLSKTDIGAKNHISVLALLVLVCVSSVYWLQVCVCEPSLPLCMLVWPQSLFMSVSTPLSPLDVYLSCYFALSLPSFSLILSPASALHRLGLRSFVRWRSAWLSCTCGQPRAHSKSEVPLIGMLDLPLSLSVITHFPFTPSPYFDSIFITACSLFCHLFSFLSSLSLLLTPSSHDVWGTR